MITSSVITAPRNQGSDIGERCVGFPWSQAHGEKLVPLTNNLTLVSGRDTKVLKIKTQHLTASIQVSNYHLLRNQSTLNGSEGSN